jgi:SPP1 gp7 family putative phage head morphogenesis protein
MATIKKPPQFGLPKRIELEYAAGMQKILGQVLPPKLPHQTYEEWLTKIMAASDKAIMLDASDLLAQRMVNWVDVKNAQSWRQAAERSQRSRKMYALLQANITGRLGSRITRLTRENAKLISSIPAYAATTLTGEIARAQQAGARPETIAKMVRKRFPELLKSRVRLISRTETSKASTALTRARCEDLNIQFYIWRTSEDVRVRDSHRRMDGVVVPWSSAPSPEALAGEDSSLGHYHAGECPNCRCTQIIVLTVDDIQFPAKVYWQSKIQRMSRLQFQKVFNLEERVAA